MLKKSRDISFIIPMYNVELFIEHCVKSILNVKWKNHSFEIIIVDDESPDNSLQIANELARNYATIKVITQRNRGLGGARNTGILNSSGNYLMFLDSDDYLITDGIIQILETAIASELDVLEFGAMRVDELRKDIGRIFQFESEHPLNGLEYLGRNKFANSACNKIYRREFLADNKVLFLEGVYIEDAPFNVEVFVKARKVGAVPNVIVAFLENQKSITRSKRSGRLLHKFISDSILVTGVIDSFTSVAVYKDAEATILSKVAMFTAGIILMIVKSDQPIKVKLEYIKDLEGRGLYPIKHHSGILIRDMFIHVVNVWPFLKIMLWITSLKTRLLSIKSANVNVC